MLRLLKRLAWVGVWTAGLQGALAFSLLGPFNEPYQVFDLGYNVPVWGDIGAPKNIAEEYRRNTPYMYYAFDQTFLDYFGSNGVYAVDQAFAILNALAPVSSYSSNLTEFPLETRRVNYKAGVLGLMDLKSEVLSVMMEQLGLAQPVRYTWDIHDRFIGPGGCPADVTYIVTKRNLGLVPTALDQLQYSSYVNGVLYSYYILENCAPPPGGLPTSQAVALPVDPLTSPYGAVAESAVWIQDLGGFYTGLTRDDVGGLRYLIRSGNVNWEAADSNSVMFYTNYTPTAQQLLVTSNLALLVSQSYTNDDAGLTALYPNLVINTTIPMFTNVLVTNVFSYFTNPPWAPAGSPSVQVNITNYETNVALVYARSFANVVTNIYSTNTWVTTLETNVSYAPWGYPGQVVTNITRSFTLTSLLSGDYYILPTNSCGVQIIRTQLVQVTFSTNLVYATTNAPGTTNAFGGTNAESYSLSIIYPFTNYNFVVYPVQCLSNVAGLMRGIEKMTFLRRDYDSLVGQFFYPQSNNYTMTMVTNSTNWVQTYQRVVTRPDFLFQARDFLPGPAGQPVWVDTVRTLTFNAANALPGLAGPGTITTPTTILFNKGGPPYLNRQPGNLDELTATLLEMWGSFDETTNAPVIYPNGTSIESLESMILMSVTTTSLPPAALQVSYSTTLAGTGGSPPYSWSLISGTNSLPLGFKTVPVPDGAGGWIESFPNGIISGKATQLGTFPITVRMTDSAGRYVNQDLALVVGP